MSFTFRDVKGDALRKRIKYCRQDPCECLEEFIREAVDEEMHNSLPARHARGLGPNANVSGIQSHADHYENRKSGVREARKLQDQFCRGGPPGGAGAKADEWLKVPFPTKEDWEAANGGTMPQNSAAWDATMGTLGAIGLGALTVVEGVATVGAAAVPFDGPVGEMALGTATAYTGYRAARAASRAWSGFGRLLGY